MLKKKKKSVFVNNSAVKCKKHMEVQQYNDRLVDDEPGVGMDPERISGGPTLT